MAIMLPSQGRDEGSTPSTRTIFLSKKIPLPGIFFYRYDIHYSSFKLIISRTSPPSRICFTCLLNSKNGILIDV